MADRVKRLENVIWETKEKQREQKLQIYIPRGRKEWQLRTPNIPRPTKNKIRRKKTKYIGLWLEVKKKKKNLKDKTRGWLFFNLENWRQWEGHFTYQSSAPHFCFLSSAYYFPDSSFSLILPPEKLFSCLLLPLKSVDHPPSLLWRDSQPADSEGWPCRGTQWQAQACHQPCSWPLKERTKA